MGIVVFYSLCKQFKATTQYASKVANKVSSFVLPLNQSYTKNNPRFVNYARVNCYQMSPLVIRKKAGFKDFCLPDLKPPCLCTIYSYT